MIYEDKYLKFPDEATQKGFYDMSDEENPVNLFPQLFWDIIGIIYEPTGETTTDSEGNEVPVMAPVDGWHVNVRLKQDDTFPDDLKPYQIYPNNPVRRWL